MNVYVRQLATALGEMGMKIDIFTREHLDVVNQVETIGPNVRVIHLKAGEPDAQLEDLYALLPDFLEQLNDFREEEGLKYDVVHSHYWLSAWAGRELSQAINVPHVVNPVIKALVPSIGSSTQTYSASSFSSPNSSPLMP